MQEKFDPSAKYARHPKAHTSGGIHLKDQAAKVTEIGLSIIKSLGYKLKDGGVFDLLKVSRPAIISYHKTYLECLGGDYYYTDHLQRAAQTSDPVERLKNVVTFYIAGIHRCSAEMQNNGPLNPIVGETYFAEKKDGTGLYCEQISHHPPVSAYLLMGPNRSYKLYGTGELDVKLNGVNNIIGKRIGKSIVEFADGGKISFTNPDTRIDGMLMGDRRYNYIKTCVFLDKINKLSAEVTFLYEETGAVTKIAHGLKSLFGASKSKPTTDLVDIVLFKFEKQADGELKKDVICEGTGSWVSHLQIDGKVHWKFDEAADPWIEDLGRRLPSDSLFREDSKFIRAKDYDSAQKEKENLENKQRADAKLRKENLEKTTATK